MFEDQKDSIKLTSLVSKVVDADTQAKIDIVKSRLIRDYGYDDESRHRRAELRGQHLRPGRRQAVSLTTLINPSLVELRPPTEQTSKKPARV